MLIVMVVKRKIHKQSEGKFNQLRDRAEQRKWKSWKLQATVPYRELPRSYLSFFGAVEPTDPLPENLRTRFQENHLSDQPEISSQEKLSKKLFFPPFFF